MFPERPRFATWNKHDTRISCKILSRIHVLRDLCAEFPYNRLTRRKHLQGSSTYFSQDLRPSESAIRHTTFAKETTRAEKEIGFVGKYDTVDCYRRKNPGNNIANLLASRYSPEYAASNIQTIAV